MTVSERVALHRRLSEGMIDALANSVERQRVDLPAEYRVSEEAVLWAPMVFGDETHRYGEELGATGQSPSDRITAEFQAYWKLMPDFRLVAHGTPFVSEIGFAVWFRFEGTTEDGRTLGLYEADYIQTNEQMEISRIETFHDLKGLAAIFEPFGVSPDSGWEALRTLRAQPTSDS